MDHITSVLDELSRIYTASVARLREDVMAFAATGTLPPKDRRHDGSYCYPELRIHFGGEPSIEPTGHSFGRLSQKGTYACTVTRPALFADYLTEQLGIILQGFDVTVEAAVSRQEIPFAYVLDGSLGAQMGSVGPQELARHFPNAELAHIGDEIADGEYNVGDGPLPLALFDGLRTDFSLARLTHYTGTPAEDFQRYILFTNYHRYVDEFIRWAIAELKKPGSRYSALSCSGGAFLDAGNATQDLAQGDGGWRKFQMPAWHLMAPDGQGVSLVNIGVGPSNAKTITDHLAVLRPQAWLMIGHCGGLRPSQTIGDYVLAHAYLRDDHVLDDMLPPEIPIPAIAEVQQALSIAAERVTGLDSEALKPRLRTGTVVTTDDRNWELRFGLSSRRFNQSRAVAVDMESATIAAQGYRFRVPYGTLLCVSDKPLHGEIKLPGQANRFYEGAISEHLQIGISAVELLREQGGRVHSRKLRAFDEPPFR
jgi:AMP nucleosidase